MPQAFDSVFPESGLSADNIHVRLVQLYSEGLASDGFLGSDHTWSGYGDVGAGRRYRHASPTADAPSPKGVGSTEPGDEPHWSERRLFH